MLSYHLTIGTRLVLNYRFLGRSEGHYRDIIQLMGLQPGAAENGREIVFTDLPDDSRMKDILEHVMENSPIRFCSDDWIRHPTRHGAAWECKKEDGWIVCADFTKDSFTEGYPKGLRIWTTLLLNFPTVMTAQKSGGILLHGALVSYQEKGIVISAKGGVGKTTTCRRLPDSWEVHADDQVLLFPDKNGALMAHALPTMSTFWDNEKGFSLNISRPVSMHAFVFLNRADRNSLTRLPERESLSSLFLGVVHMSRVYWRFLEETERQACAATIVNRCRALASERPSWHLKLSLKGPFWKDLETILQ